MSYTPINWQNGDFITAEKLNKMDRGWDVSEATLFNETVTTVDYGGVNGGTLSYVFTEEPPQSLTITFDDVEYQCYLIQTDEYVFNYGANTESGPLDFTSYPFLLMSNPNGVELVTETAGTHTISAKILSAVCSNGFANAVKTAQVGHLLVHINSETGALDKTWQEIYNAAPMVWFIDSTSGDHKFGFLCRVGHPSPSLYDCEFMLGRFSSDGETSEVNIMYLGTVSASGYPVLDYSDLVPPSNPVPDDDIIL